MLVCCGDDDGLVLSAVSHCTGSAALAIDRLCGPHLGVGLGVAMRAARAAAGLGVAASWARCTITADMDTVDTTADATMASIIALITCRGQQHSAETLEAYNSTNLWVLKHRPTLSVALLICALPSESFRESSACPTLSFGLYWVACLVHLHALRVPIVRATHSLSPNMAPQYRPETDVGCADPAVGVRTACEALPAPWAAAEATWMMALRAASMVPQSVTHAAVAAAVAPW